jgi:hypothetical protein
MPSQQLHKTNELTNIVTDEDGGWLFITFMIQTCGLEARYIRLWMVIDSAWYVLTKNVDVLVTSEHNTPTIYTLAKKNLPIQFQID